jgi:hypothetical protein
MHPIKQKKTSMSPPAAAAIASAAFVVPLA